MLAGAGSGKTRVITGKLLYLIREKKLSPYHLLAITFTNKAANEMRQRLAAYVKLPVPRSPEKSTAPPQLSGLQIKTFHSWGAFVLHRFIHKLPGYSSNFTIVDETAKLRLIKELLREAGESQEKAKDFSKLFSSWKNAFLYPSPELTAQALSFPYRYANVISKAKLLRHYKEYQARLVDANLVDFDDLIGLTVRLFADEECAAYLAARWRYVFVDEYQDTNLAQEEIVSFFIHKNAHVTVVGDDSQSIYGFRGANIDNILSFPKKYPKVKQIKLEENYRSSGRILTLANAVIKRGRSSFKKQLFTKKAPGAKPFYLECRNDLEEARWIGAYLKELRGKGVAAEEIAVLYRANYLSRNVEEELLRLNIPYLVMGGLSFFERKEIKELLAYLNCLVNPRDLLSFKRIINFPPRKIGSKSQDIIFHQLRQTNLSLPAAFKDQELIGRLTPSGAKAFAALGEKFAHLQQLKETSTALPSFMKQLLAESGLLTFYSQLSSEYERYERLASFDELIRSADAFQKQHERRKATEEAEATGSERAPVGQLLQSFVEMLSLNTQAEDEADRKEANTTVEQKPIHLMTVHSAKGLEYEYVHVMGMEEQTFPHALSLESETELEEERRLFYVAITRAKQCLTASSAKRKQRYGRLDSYEPSRFIKELPENAMEREYCRNEFNAPLQQQANELLGSEEHEFF